MKLQYSPLVMVIFVSQVVSVHCELNKKMEKQKPIFISGLVYNIRKTYVLIKPFVGNNVPDTRTQADTIDEKRMI